MRKKMRHVLAIITAVLMSIDLYSLANANAQEEEEKVYTPAEALVIKADGAAFLSENAKKNNIVTTASGLQYEVLVKGKGSKHPKPSDSVKVHYKGTLIDGTEFENSWANGEPVTFPLENVIPGWIEGVQLMTEGAKYRFYLPNELAYGPSGASGVAPYSALIFEIELLAIE